MRILCFIILALFVTACTSAVEIRDSNEIGSPSIKTTKIEVIEEPEKAAPKPSIKIISPQDLQTIRNSTVIVEVEAEDFKIVPMGSPAKSNEGHFHVWINGEKKVSSENMFIFENVSAGKYSITAELVKSDHSSLSPKIAKTITVNVDYEMEKGETKPTALSEYIIEADDNGFYPSRIRAHLGNKVTINFKFRDHLIYYAGLDIKGPFEDVRYKTGGEQPIARNFTMKGETRIASYWPSTGVKKAELLVEVVN